VILTELQRRRTAVAAMLRLLPRYALLAVLKHLVPIRTLARWSWRTPGTPLPGPALDRLIARVVRLSDVVGLFDRDCLQRSLLLYGELARACANPSLMVGFRRERGRLEGHAWVEVDGKPVAELAQPLETFQVALSFGAHGQVFETTVTSASP
jgi:hypothetical protein